MAMTCSFCRSPKLAVMNEALIGGGPLRAIADRWSGSKSLLRHNGKRR
jgi:hypothetical protein